MVTVQSVYQVIADDSKTVLFESRSGSAAIQWAIDYYLEIEIADTIQVDGSLDLRKKDTAK